MHANTLTLDVAREREAELVDLATASVGPTPVRRRRRLVIVAGLRRRLWRASAAPAGS